MSSGGLDWCSHPLRLERRAVRAGATSARVVVTGAGAARSREYRRVNLNGSNGHGARGPVAIAGFGGGLDPDLEPGDLVVATEVRLADGATCSFPAARLLAGELQRAGLRAIAGPIRIRRAPRPEAVPASSWPPTAPSPSTWSRPGSSRATRSVAPRPSCGPWSTRPGASWCRRGPRTAPGGPPKRCGPAVPVLERWAAATGRPARACSPRRGPSAPASSGPSTSSSGPSSATARPCTSAARSSTTPTSSPTWPSAAPSSSTSSTRCPRAAASCSPPTASRPSVRDEAGDRDLPADRRHLPAGRQGPRRGAAVRRARLPRRADRPRRPRGGRGHGRRGARRHHRRRARRRRRRHRGRRSRPRRLRHPDHARRRRGGRGRRPACRDRFPKLEGPPRDDICYATQNRQDAVRALAAAVRPRARGRLAQLVELQPARRGRAAGGLPRPTSSTTTASSSSPGSPVPAPSASPPARRPRRRWCSASSPRSAPSGRSRSRSAPS